VRALDELGLVVEIGDLTVDHVHVAVRARGEARDRA